MICSIRHLVCKRDVTTLNESRLTCYVYTFIICIRAETGNFYKLEVLTAEYRIHEEIGSVTCGLSSICIAVFVIAYLNVIGIEYLIIVDSCN